jgi:hypothetical protein
VRKAAVLRGAKAVLKEGFAMQVPKIPWDLYAATVQWFRDVHAKHKAEAYVQYWLCPDGNEPTIPEAALTAKVEGGTYYVYVPEQDISGGGVEHQSKHDVEGTSGNLHVMDVHSHHTMGAFWSATDDGDEKKHERLYGVVGTIDKLIPSSKWRTCIAGTFIDLDLGHVVAVPTMNHAFTIPFDELIKHGGAVDISKVAVDPFEKVGFPEVWSKSLITERKHKGGGQGSYWGWQRRFGMDDYGDPTDDMTLPVITVLDKSNGFERLLRVKNGDVYELTMQDGKLSEKFLKRLDAVQ